MPSWDESEREGSFAAGVCVGLLLVAPLWAVTIYGFVWMLGRIA